MAYPELALVMEDGDDLLFFSSLNAAVTFLEGWSIPKSGGLAYTLDGQRFLVAPLNPNDDVCVRGQQVLVTAATRDEPGEKDLAELLMRHLPPAQPSSALSRPSLNALIDAAVRRYGWAG